MNPAKVLVLFLFCSLSTVWAGEARNDKFTYSPECRHHLNAAAKSAGPRSRQQTLANDLHEFDALIRIVNNSSEDADLRQQALITIQNWQPVMAFELKEVATRDFSLSSRLNQVCGLTSLAKAFVWSDELQQEIASGLDGVIQDRP